MADTRAVENKEAPNVGHGHVRPRPDGVKARCGGPALCSVCQREARKYAQAVGTAQA